LGGWEGKAVQMGKEEGEWKKIKHGAAKAQNLEEKNPIVSLGRTQTNVGYKDEWITVNFGKGEKKRDKLPSKIQLEEPRGG